MNEKNMTHILFMRTHKKYRWVSSEDEVSQFAAYSPFFNQGSFLPGCIWSKCACKEGLERQTQPVQYVVTDAYQIVVAGFFLFCIHTTYVILLSEFSLNKS